MFEMTPEEFEAWRSQFVISNTDKKGLRYAPFVCHQVYNLNLRAKQEGILCCDL
ncbi:MAG: hypothetical protein ABI851_05745 [Saprospiraceae bacterium]